MKYLILYHLFTFFGFLIFSVFYLFYHFIRACALMLWDLDKAYENEVLKKTKEYREFEKELNKML